MPCAATYRQLLEQVVTGKITPQGWEQLRGHLALCGACRRRYDRAVYVERLLAGGPNALGVAAPSELWRLGEAAIAQVPDAKNPRPLWAWMRWLVPALAATAVALLVLPGVLSRSPGSPDRRGSSVAVSPSAAPAQGGGRTLLAQGSRSSGTGASGAFGALPASVSAYCIEAGAALDSAAGDKPRLHALGIGDACGASQDLLRLSYSNGPNGYPYLFVLGLDADLDIKWYEPAPPATQSVRIREGQSDVALGPGIKLSAQHRAGPLRIVALFSRQPLEAKAVEAAVARARAEKRDLSTLVQLDGLPAGVYQSSLLVQLR